MNGLSPLVYGGGGYDPSDARNFHDSDSPTGSGVGSAPTPGDGRLNQDVNPEPEAPYDLSAPYARVSPLLTDDDPWPNDPSDIRPMGDPDAPHGSAGALGSPEFEYSEPRQIGIRVEANGPIDGGMADPIRDGWTPARRAVTRYLFTRAAWRSWTPGEFTGEKTVIGAAFHGAQQPAGRMSPMDEYRLLSDGSHA
jgi:hypothetical protein